VQDFSKMNNEKDHIINDLKTRVEKLESMMNVQSSMSIDKQTIKISSVFLQQNIPNPFHAATKINYELPQQFSSAKIIITDKSGKIIKEINVSGSGKGSLNLDALTLSAGAYQYSLYINSKLIDTKQMVLLK
jgi:trimeric autotransporter adhesin